MGADDSIDDKQTQSRSRTLCGEVRIEDLAHLLLADAFACVDELDVEEDVVGEAADEKLSSVWHGLDGVLDDVEEGLRQLVWIAENRREWSIALVIDVDISRKNLVLHEGDGRRQELLDVDWLRGQWDWTHGRKEVLNDGIQPLHLG